MHPRHALLLTMAAALLPGRAQSDLLVVLAKSDHEAALVDPVSLEVVARLPTGQGPHEVAVSPDGRRAYVSNYGAYAIFREGEKPAYDPGHSLTVLDLERRAVADTFELGRFTSPHGIVVSRDGKRLWVTCEGAKAVLEIDAASGKPLKQWNTEQEVSHMLVVTPDERKLYVTNIRSGSVTVISRTDGTVRSITTGAGTEGIDLSPDGREVWVSNRGSNTLTVIAVEDDQVRAAIAAGAEMPIRVKFTPDGQQVWVSNARSRSVGVFDAARRRRIELIEVGAVPVGIQMSPDGSRAFVACSEDDLVTVIDVRERKVTGSFSPGREPDGMAWAVSPAPRDSAAARTPRATREPVTKPKPRPKRKPQ